MTTRLTAMIIAVLDTAGWLLAAVTLLWAQADPAGLRLDLTAAVALTLLFAVTGLPALLLAGLGRAPRASLVLALGFPLAFLGLLGAVLVALP